MQEESWGMLRDGSIYASCQDIWKHCNSSVRELAPHPARSSTAQLQCGFRESQLAGCRTEDRGWMRREISTASDPRAWVNPGAKRSRFPLDTYSNFIAALTASTSCSCSCRCSCICARGFCVCVTRYCIWQIHGAAYPWGLAMAVLMMLLMLSQWKHGEKTNS